jgi:hypothetical protein
MVSTQARPKSQLKKWLAKFRNGGKTWPNANKKECPARSAILASCIINPGVF